MEKDALGRRKTQRRKEKERRTDAKKDLYKRLISRKVMHEERKRERRQGERREKFFQLFNKGKYAQYKEEMEKLNTNRKKIGLEPLPYLTIEEWLSRLR